MRVASREVKPSHFMALSFASSLFAGLAKLVMAFLTQSLLVGFNALYSLVLCIPRFSSARATRNRERAHALRRHSGERMPARSSKRTAANAGELNEGPFDELRSPALRNEAKGPVRGNVRDNVRGLRARSGERCSRSGSVERNSRTRPAKRGLRTRTAKQGLRAGALERRSSRRDGLVGARGTAVQGCNFRNDSCDDLFNDSHNDSRNDSYDGFRPNSHDEACISPRDEAEESRSQALTAVFIVFLGLVFLGMSNHTFVNGEGLRMSTIPAITFATCAFTKIGTAIYGVVKERGNTSSVVFANKLTSLADGMASIVLTQMALRSSQGQQSDIFDAVFGMAVGFVIVLMGIWLFKRTQAPSR